MSESDLKIVCESIERAADVLNRVSQGLWKNPEIQYEEVFAHKLLTDVLSDYGFQVTRHYLLPTAFRAEYSSQKVKGPTIAIILEYDALPVIGHGCGHNLISEAGIAAGIAVKAAMEKDPALIGTVVIFGTPAEEGGGGKIKMINKGAFENIDAAMMVHPRKFTIYSPPTLSWLSCRVDFSGRESHASAIPWEGLNALDAVVTFYQSVALLRQQIKPTHRIHAIITKGGSAASVIPADTQVLLYLRTPTRKEMDELRPRIENCMLGAAASTGCTHTVHYDEHIYYTALNTNPVLIDIFGKFATQLGLPENDMIGPVPAASTDMGNVSEVVPSIHPVYAIHTEAANHTKDFTDASGSPKAQEPTLAAGKSMAMTVLTLLRHPEKLREVRDLFQQEQH